MRNSIIGKNQPKRRGSRIPRAVALPPLKYHDFATVGSSSTTFAAAAITLVPIGTSQSNRLANTLFLERLEVRIIFTCSTSDVTNVIRWSLFHWAVNSTPSTDSYYEDPTVYGVLTPLNFEGRKQFKTLVDRTVLLSGTSGAPTSITLRNFETVMPVRSRVDFLSSSSTAGINHIYFSHFSDSAVTPFPQISATFRTWYRDTQ